jgi:prepilin-type N-terminal cleavage/methylation domain-containing protein
MSRFISSQVKPSKGFTLVEMLIAMVVIAILAAISIPRFSSTIEKSSDAAAVADLRNAMTAQEAYMYDYATYTSLANLAITTSTGVSIGGGGSASGYSLTAKHQSSTATFGVTLGGGSSTEGKILKQ